MFVKYVAKEDLGARIVHHHSRNYSKVLVAFAKAVDFAGLFGGGVAVKALLVKVVQIPVYGVHCDSSRGLGELQGVGGRVVIHLESGHVGSFAVNQAALADKELSQSGL